jgi:hypothetical protein
VHHPRIGGHPGTPDAFQPPCASEFARLVSEPLLTADFASQVQHRYSTPSHVSGALGEHAPVVDLAPAAAAARLARPLATDASLLRIRAARSLAFLGKLVTVLNGETWRPQPPRIRMGSAAAV